MFRSLKFIFLSRLQPTSYIAVAHDVEIDARFAAVHYVSALHTSRCPWRRVGGRVDDDVFRACLSRRCCTRSQIAAHASVEQ
jgi:hypothetical protein